MKLAWATDIHLNFIDPPRRAAFASEVRATGADALLVTGDIAESRNICDLLGELDQALELPIYFVLGNHDFYGSSVAEVHARIREMCAASERLRWLSDRAAIRIDEGVALVGCDGWADGRYGDYARSPVELNDSVHINDLAELFKGPRLTVMQRLADASAASLRERLTEALCDYQRVIVATHVPPFAEACWHEGRISGPDWLPYFASKATGDVLLESADAWPAREIEVYCGHTHSGGIARVRPNLVVTTGASEYGEPRVCGVLEMRGIR